MKTLNRDGQAMIHLWIKDVSDNPNLNPEAWYPEAEMAFHENPHGDAVIEMSGQYTWHGRPETLAIPPSCFSSPPYPFCFHPDKCRNGRCERAIEKGMSCCE